MNISESCAPDNVIASLMIKKGTWGHYEYPSARLGEIKKVLAKHGINWQITQQCGPYKLSQSSNSHPLGDFVRSNARGLIDVTELSQIPVALKTVAEAYPNSGIAVLGSPKDIQRVKNELSKADLGKRFLPERYRDEPNISDPDRNSRFRQLEFSTAADAGASERDLELRDFVFLLDANSITHSQGKSFLCQVDQRYRLFGFCQSWTLGKDQRKHLAHWYGDASITMLGKNRYLSPVWTYFFKTRRAKTGNLSGRLDPLEIKEQGLWNNSSRNELMAKRIASLVTGDWQTLHLQNHELPPSLVQEAPRVAVLAENTYHRENLKSSLDARSGLIGQNPPQIVTFSEAGNGQRVNFNLLIRADGNNGNPMVLNDLVSLNKMFEPVLVIDFHDSHHRELTRWSTARKEGYRQIGWMPLRERSTV
ncbi:hypothetical protein [uncultured Rubinisphaera sp.]|uniref:hypothetical protein n=2 Tax=Rubinisphaera TaxID=1649490 RepID=UPI0030DAA5F0